MCSTYSAALADSRSGLSEPECTPSHSASQIDSAAPSSPSSGRACPVTTTCASSPATDSGQMEFFPISSVAASRAKTLATRERAQALTAKARGYGPSSPEYLASFDRGSRSWKTLQRSLIEGWATFSDRWPRSGLMQSGRAYALPILERSTSEIEFGLLPTPQANDWRSGRGYSHGGKRPTPQLRHMISGLLNPRFVEQLMGFPIEWTALERSETLSSRKLRKRLATLSQAANARAWAIGQQQGNGFHVRQIVWGLLMAQAEKREGEEIRAAVLMIGPPRKRGRKTHAPE
jgi:hypothetical protein